MAWFDLDGFVASLADRGVPAAQVPLYREAATALLTGAPGGRFTDDALDQALAREALAGATARRLANLRLVGGQMVEFVGAAAATIAGPGVSASPHPPAVAAPIAAVAAPIAAVVAAPVVAVVAAAGAQARAPLELDLAIDVPRRGAPPPSERVREAMHAPVPPLPGCVCRQRQDVYIDDYWQDMGKIYLTIIAILGGATWRLAPPYAWTVATTGMLALGALITGLTVGWRCEHCRRWIAGRGLDADQRAEARKRGGVFLVIAAVLALACAVSVQAFRKALDRGPRAPTTLFYD